MLMNLLSGTLIKMTLFDHLEKSCLTLSSSLMLCRFLRAGYREDTASRLPLHSSSTSAPLLKQTHG